MNPSIATRTANLRATAVNRVLAEVRELQKQGKSPVSLMRGQPDLPTPAHIVEAAERSLRDGRTGYPNNQGEPILREAIAAKLARAQGLQYDPTSEILVTDGATCGVSTALAALIDPGAGVLLPSPIYDAYMSPIALWGGQALPVPATIQANRFVINRAALEAAYRPHARVLLLNNPWNPVGTVLTRNELEDITAFCVERDLWVISDEIYESLVYGRTDLQSVFGVSIASLSPEIRNRTVIANSLSKTYAMTGWRVGYCAGPAEAIRAMFLVLQQFSRGPATFVQDAAACALNGDQSCVAEMATEFAAQRDTVVNALQGLLRVKALTPQGGLFVMVDIGQLGRASDEVRQFLLRELGVVVVHGSAFGPEGEGLLRISFAAGGEVLSEGLRRLRAGLKRLDEQKEH